MSCFAHDQYLDLEAQEVDTQAHSCPKTKGVNITVFKLSDIVECL
jgi:hypothetical protein